MYQNSLDAIRAFLNTAFPEIERIYVNDVPAGFIRPSFFIEFVLGSGDDLNRSIYEQSVTWQIVYFAPRNEAGSTDRFNQLAMAAALKLQFMEAMVLTAPDGLIFHISGCDVETRDDEVYCTLRLEAEGQRPETEFDVVGYVAHTIKEG